MSRVPYLKKIIKHMESLSDVQEVDRLWNKMSYYAYHVVNDRYWIATRFTGILVQVSPEEYAEWKKIQDLFVEKVDA